MKSLFTGQLLTAGTVDQEAGTITLPLYRGQLSDAGTSGTSSRTRPTRATPRRWG
jgi:hypothetical protein